MSTPDTWVLVGEAPLAGVGEAAVTVPFAVRFVEKPVFTYSFDLGDNPMVAPADIPEGSAVVGKWDLGVRPGTGARYYDGAVVLVRIRGHAFNRPILHYRFEGTALTGPGGRE